jgi:tetratricopeptide (TPR) repeat protein
MNTLTLRKQASKLVLAVALATGTAMVAGHVFPDEAHAQRKKKKKKKEKKAKEEYSEEWRAVFVPLDKELKDGADPASLQARIDQVLGLTVSPDEKLQTGQLIYNAGIKTEDLNQRMIGIELMLESNKLPLDIIPQYNYIAFQVARNLKDTDKALKYLDAAMGLGFTDANINSSTMLIDKANLYFDSDRSAEGLSVLSQAIDASAASGTKAPESWYTFGFSKAYNAALDNPALEPQAYTWAQKRVAAYPTETFWLDAINVVRQFKDFGDKQELDLLRLVRKVGAMKKSSEFRAFIDAANAVLSPYPQEVKEVIEEGYQLGTIDRTDEFIAEVLGAVTRRIEDDKPELPSYAADARAASADLETVVIAGDTFLSYDEYDEAAEFYAKALTMPGVDTEAVNTHLGMALIGKGDYEGAKAALANVVGDRKEIASLWAAYAIQESGGAAGTAGEEESGPSLGELMGASS